jgi:aminoglycoside phosphotransferase (APT) family kinase protein
MQVVRAIIRWHDLRIHNFSLESWIGGGSCVYRLGKDYVLKVPHHDPAPIASMQIEAVAAAAGRAAGVRTPRLIAFDDTLDLLPVPYLVYERVHGQPLSQLETPPAMVHQVWRAVGSDLARLHTADHPAPLQHLLPTHGLTPDTDPRPWVEELQAGGGLSPTQARWLADILERLAPAALSMRVTCLCHGDVNAANVLVGPSTPRAYTALLDWGGAGWADPALDFSAVSLDAIPFMLAGYREIARLPDDNTAEARILWYYLRLALFSLRRADTTESERHHRIARLLQDTQAYLIRARLNQSRGA